eukprot:CAMPEP_0182494302 /NCGR_PEP_ID=MMETSP1321-20130603/3187_1 /TAXON_ID=91990 /ORGANISM="Bolidomonas sp., Strain RCC1657" /LENGTH=38 /DNA_ID= /DNA_START= /DNA_END= /DNA_ORIENTATION=
MTPKKVALRLPTTTINAADFGATAITSAMSQTARPSEI